MIKKFQQIYLFMKDYIESKSRLFGVKALQFSDVYKIKMGEYDSHRKYKNFLKESKE